MPVAGGFGGEPSGSSPEARGATDGCAMGTGAPGTTGTGCLSDGIGFPGAGAGALVMGAAGCGSTVGAGAPDDGPVVFAAGTAGVAVGEEAEFEGVAVGCGAGVFVGAVVAGGTGVFVGGMGVFVGATEVLVGGSGVLVGCTGVFVGGTGVLVGWTAVLLAVGWTPLTVTAATLVVTPVSAPETVPVSPARVNAETWTWPAPGAAAFQVMVNSGQLDVQKSRRKAATLSEPVVPGWPASCVQPPARVIEAGETTAGLYVMVTSNPLRESAATRLADTWLVTVPPGLAEPPVTTTWVPAEAEPGASDTSSAPAANSEAAASVQNRPRVRWFSKCSSLCWAWLPGGRAREPEVARGE